MGPPHVATENSPSPSRLSGTPPGGISTGITASTQGTCNTQERGPQGGREELKPVSGTGEEYIRGWDAQGNW